MKTLIFLFLPMLASWCSGPAGKEKESNKSTNSEVTLNQPSANQLIASDHPFNSLLDTTPFRFLPYGERHRLSSIYHYFGSTKLKRTEWPVYQYIDSTADMLIRELQPNVLLYKSLSGEFLPSRRLEFYDYQGRLVRKIPIDQYGPYLHLKDRIIGFTPPNREYYEDPENPNNDCNYSNLPLADSYLMYPGVSVFPSGYACIGYSLAKISTKDEGHLIVGWEENTNIYNPQGVKVANLVIPHDARSYFVSSNGRYIMYLYGGISGDNPLDYCKGAIVVYDIIEKKTILENIQSSPVYTMAGEREKTDFIEVGMDIKLTEEEYSEQTFIDLSTRTLYWKKFTKSEYFKAYGRGKSNYDLVKSGLYHAKKF